MSFSLAFFNAPTTYGVLPLAAIPKTTSAVETLCDTKSFHPCSTSSSANSTAFLMAESPPAIKPMTFPCSRPNVGGSA